MSRTLQTLLGIARLPREHASYQEIADALHVSLKTIATVKGLLDDHRPIEIPRPRGRLSKMPPPVIATVRNKTIECPFIGDAKLARTMESQLGIHISRQTIGCIHRRLHFRYTSPSRRPMLSVTQRQNRVDFCRNALEGRIDSAHDAVISDEPRFGLFNDNKRRWIPREEHPDDNRRVASGTEGKRGRSRSDAGTRRGGETG
jgi:hypothetical protein